MIHIHVLVYCACYSVDLSFHVSLKGGIRVMKLTWL